MGNIEKKLKSSSGILRLINKFMYDVSIKNKLYTIIIIITIVPIVIYSIFQYNTSADYLYEQQKSFLSSSAQNVKVILDSILRNMVKASDDISYNKAINQLITKEQYDSTFEIVERNQKLTQYISPLLDKQIYNMYSESPDMNLSLMYANFYIKKDTYLNYAAWNFINTFLLEDTIKENSDLAKCYNKLQIQQIDNSYIWEIGSQKKGTPFNENSISVNTIFRKLTNFEEIGMLSVQCDKKIFSNVLNTFSKEDEMLLYLTDNSNNTITSNRLGEHNIEAYNKLNRDTSLDDLEDSFYDLNYNKSDYLVKKVGLSTNDWNLVAFHSVKSLNKQKSNQIMLVVLLCIACLIFSFVSMLLLSRTITVRLTALIRRMGDVKTYLKKESMHISGSDEIGKVDAQFVDMLNQINILIKKNNTMLHENNIVKVELLQQQINPHLLYNSLSAIRYLAMYDRSKEVNQITESLIRFYKLSLNNGNTIVPIQEEINICEEYIKLISKVYDIDVDYEFFVEEKIKGNICLKLLLQPIVENAVLHGFKKLDRKAKLIISVYIKGNTICIDVTDNGKGMGSEKAKSLLDEKDIDSGIKGFGLSNVNRRVKLYYGSQYAMTIESEQNVGTTVKITLPNELDSSNQ